MGKKCNQCSFRVKLLPSVQAYNGLGIYDTCMQHMLHMRYTIHYVQYVHMQSFPHDKLFPVNGSHQTRLYNFLKKYATQTHTHIVVGPFKPCISLPLYTSDYSQIVISNNKVYSFLHQPATNTATLLAGWLAGWLSIILYCVIFFACHSRFICPFCVYLSIVRTRSYIFICLCTVYNIQLNMSQFIIIVHVYGSCFIYKILVNT